MDKEPLSLQDIQKIELSILKYLKAFCEERSLTYFISNGTLLGAIKYGGFIPWDDDIDILMPRSDYNELLKSFADNEKYKLFSPDRTPEFGFPFAKLCDMTTVRIENNVNNGCVLGIDIDIFPIDSWDSKYQIACKQAVRNVRIMRNLGYAKSTNIVSRNIYRMQIKKVVVKICKCFGMKFFRDRLANCVCNKEKSLYCGCVVWPVYGRREIIPSGVFADKIMVKFENINLPAPIGYNKYLRSLYGDYSCDPPLEKQKTHHNFKAYRL